MPPSTVPEPQSFSWNPAEGVALRRVMERTTTTTTEESTMAMGENEQDVGSGMVRTATGNIELMDQFRSTSDEGPLAFLRSFAALTQSTETEGVPGEVQLDTGDDQAGLLEEKQVLFQRESADDDFDVSWAEDSEGESSWLEDFDADMDFVAFLPEGEVEPGGFLGGGRGRRPQPVLARGQSLRRAAPGRRHARRRHRHSHPWQ